MLLINARRLVAHENASDIVSETFRALKTQGEKRLWLLIKLMKMMPVETENNYYDDV